MIGAQHDMLCREARDMILSLAQKSVFDPSWEDGWGSWGSRTYKWMLVMGGDMASLILFAVEEEDTAVLKHGVRSAKRLTPRSTHGSRRRG